MPATEKTWYNQNLLHVIFAVSSLVLLVATIWMISSDHSREWKVFQDEFREAERRLNEWRQEDTLTAENLAERESLEHQLAVEQSKVPPKNLMEAFEEALLAFDESANFKPVEPVYEKLEEQSNVAAAALQKLEAARGELNATRSSLQQAMEAGRSATPETADAAMDAIAAAEEAEAAVLASVDAANDGFKSEAAKAAKTRQRLMMRLDQYAKKVRQADVNLLGKTKFRRANLDEAKANLDLAVRDGKSELQPSLQEAIDKVKADVNELSSQQNLAQASRETLEGLIREMSAGEAAVTRKLDENRAEYERLQIAIDDRSSTYFTSSFPFLGKKWLEMPVGNAFNSPHKIDNLWTEGLTQENGSFGQVRRFDRCTTCHRGIDKTAPGSAIEPAYPEERELVFYVSANSDSDDSEVDLMSRFGIALAEVGLIDRDDVTIKSVVPLSPAATAMPVDGQDSGKGLAVGDVLMYVNDDQVDSPQQATKLMLDDIDGGETVRVVVRRGLPQPFSSHPRLDLFVGSLSPHKLSVFGCSVCHDGQGSGTEFKWVSHTPNSPEQADEWRDEYGWFNNHHWIYPMYPARFAESSCLKCHHDVTELEASERFPEPPAPKLMKGYHLVSEYGCFGCHEINGYESPGKTQGPDLRLEPNYFAGAAQVKADPNYDKLTDEQRSWVQSVINAPDVSGPRHRLLALLEQDKDAAESQESESLLSGASHKMIEVLADTDTPGKMRKVGPALRYAKSKLTTEFLADWIWEPKHFRPNTRMPQFFGHWDHLGDKEKEIGQKLEPIELAGMVTYLLERSQPFELEPLEEGIAESNAEEQVERGKLFFETRGCLACHQHDDFPYAEATKGPDLTNIGDKFAGKPDGKDWLRNWLRSPSNYHSRTSMPKVLKLDPEETADGKKIDPADDIAAYLAASSSGWKPSEEVVGWVQNPEAIMLEEENEDGEKQKVSALDKLTREYLGKAFFTQLADEYLKTGIPESRAASLKGAEVELIGGASQKQKLMYIGSKTIAKYGCFGCHDIPGFENAKPIGAALADWGRKDPSKLAFEHIMEYLHEGHGHGGHGGGHAVEGESAEHDDDEGHEYEDADSGHDADGHDDHDGHEVEIDEAFYVQKIAEHDRAGFAWQKLKEPRSYDYEKARNKDFNERLRMPLFPFNDEEREAVVTFVLGLVADPPAHQFVYHPDEKQQALIAGRKVLDKYNCMGCHVLEAERWELTYNAGQLSPPSGGEAGYPFMKTVVSAADLEKSGTADPRLGTFSSTIHGLPAVDDDGLQIIRDDELDPIDLEDIADYDPNSLIYSFQLWKPTLIEGKAVEAGPPAMDLPVTTITKMYPAFGGDLTFWLLPRVVEIEKETNPNAKGGEAYGWLPPPLIGQGTKVQPSWLHEFLLDPYSIRPAVFMGMPKFNMSSEEAAALVNYFAARDGADYPYEFNNRAQAARLAKVESEYQDKLSDASEKPEGEGRLDHAMNIVVSTNYCVQCHLVGDFMPTGSERAKAPNLARIGQRLRPEYLRRWIANPTQILPYTPMPVNIKYGQGVPQQLYHGTATEQLDGLVDLLMNYNVYTSNRAKIAPLVKTDAGAPQAGAN